MQLISRAMKSERKIVLKKKVRYQDCWTSTNNRQVCLLTHLSLQGHAGWPSGARAAHPALSMCVSNSRVRFSTQLSTPPRCVIELQTDARMCIRLVSLRNWRKVGGRLHRRKDGKEFRAKTRPGPTRVLLHMRGRPRRVYERARACALALALCVESSKAA